MRDENVEAQFRALGETVGWGDDAPRDARATRASYASYASIERQVSRTTLPEPEHWPSLAQVGEGRQGRATESHREPQRAAESCGEPRRATESRGEPRRAAESRGEPQRAAESRRELWRAAESRRAAELQGLRALEPAALSFCLALSDHCPRHVAALCRLAHGSCIVPYDCPYQVAARLNEDDDDDW